jgi:hypothetical protein
MLRGELGDNNSMHFPDVDSGFGRPKNLRNHKNKTSHVPLSIGRPRLKVLVRLLNLIDGVLVKQLSLCFLGYKVSASP